MNLQHVALWTRQLDDMKEFYEKYFNGVAGERYYTETEFNAPFESYFLKFDQGSQLELMQMDSIPIGDSAAGNETLGLTHIAFAVDVPEKVDILVEQLSSKGHKVAVMPRSTGDGYYEAVVLDPDGNRVEIVVPPK